MFRRKTSGRADEYKRISPLVFDSQSPLSSRAYKSSDRLCKSYWSMHPSPCSYLNGERMPPLNRSFKPNKYHPSTTSSLVGIRTGLIYGRASKHILLRHQLPWLFTHAINWNTLRRLCQWCPFRPVRIRRIATTTQPTAICIRTGILCLHRCSCHL